MVNFSIFNELSLPLNVNTVKEKFGIFFNLLEQLKNQSITKENLWNKKDEFFPQVIVFCPEVERQIKTIDKTVFGRAISILRDIELKQNLFS
jgi:hypothetical protein